MKGRNAMKFQFKSIGKSNEIGYVYDSLSYSKNDFGLHDSLFQYNTYGDGNTQHTPEYPVSVDNYTDFVISLIDHFRKDMKLAFDVCMFFQIVEPEKIRFYNSLKYDVNKFRYYNPETMKTSTSESKQYDKRWIEIPSYCDGSLKSLVSLVFTNHVRSFWGLLNRIYLLHQIEKGMGEEFYWTDWKLSNEAEIQFNGIDENKLCNFYDKCIFLFDVLIVARKTNRIERLIENYKRDLEPSE